MSKVAGGGAAIAQWRKLNDIMAESCAHVQQHISISAARDKPLLSTMAQLTAR